MTVYALAQLRVTDRARYRAYARAFAAAVASSSGRVLAADEAPALLESWPAAPAASPANKVVLLEFPSAAALAAWAASPGYRALAAERHASSAGVVLQVQGLPPPPPPSARYDGIGAGYARVRREDPRIRARIHAALGDARTVVNVGAGAGSYEPRDRQVIAVEPSAVMVAQRPRDAAPAVRAFADELPLHDGAVDAAMAVLTLHHWDAGQERGVRELRRVARGPVAILTFDPRVSGAMWLMADYLHEVAALDMRIFPLPETIAAWLGGAVDVEIVPLARDTPDWMLGSYWAHPERVLDADARAATSGFARMPAEVVARVVADVQRDLAGGAWEKKHGHLRALEEHDVGLRLLVAR